MKINFERYLNNIRNNEVHFYDTKAEICYFPYYNEEIDMVQLSKSLNTFGEYITTKESFQERKDICEKDEEWKQFIASMKEDCDYKCQISGFGITKLKRLDHDLFNIGYNEFWINDWLNPHHIDGTLEYKCFDKSKIQIVNRAIHMCKHRYNKLLPSLPDLKWNYELWYELGCLIHDRENEYPWRKITKMEK